MNDSKHDDLSAVAELKLFWSSRSPFTRKVMIAAHETGLMGRIDLLPATVIPSKPNTDILPHNPFSQLPTLILPSGDSLFGSSVICEYFDSLEGFNRLFPLHPKRRWVARRLQALGDTMMETAIALRVEGRRTSGNQNDVLIAGYRAKITAALEYLDKHHGDLQASALDIGEITIGSALGYLDFRLPEMNWRNSAPALSRWQTQFEARPSSVATQLHDPNQ